MHIIKVLKGNLFGIVMWCADRLGKDIFHSTGYSTQVCMYFKQINVNMIQLG